MNPKVKNLIDKLSITIGVVTILSNLIVPGSCRLGSFNKVLLIVSSVLALMYLLYAGWLYCFKKADFDWHLINGHFLSKVCAVVVLIPSLLSFAGSAFLESPDDLYYNALPFEVSDSAKVVSVPEQLSPNMFWNTYLHFINPGNPHMSSTAPGRIWAVLIGMFGIFLMGGLLVSSIVGWFENRKKSWADGSIRYKLRFLGKNKFAVVIGANEIAASVIRNLFSVKQTDEVNYKSEGSNDYVILQTSRNVKEVRTELLSHLTVDELKKVIIYNALRDSDDEIENLFVEFATEIYVLGESTLMDGGETCHDALNMSCVNLIAAQLEKTRLKRVPVRKVCKVMFD